MELYNLQNPGTQKRCECKIVRLFFSETKLGSAFSSQQFKCLYLLIIRDNLESLIREE